MGLVEAVVAIMNLPGEGGYSKIRKLALKNNRHWLVGRSDLHRYYKEKKVPDISKAEEIAVIQQGLYDYDYFNICFLNNMFSLILKAVMEKRIPQIEIKNQSGENIWEMFFEQPFSEKHLEISDKKKVYYTEKKVEAFPAFDEIFSEKSIAMWGKIYQKFVRFNPKTQQYINREIEEILGDGKRVLGVLCRGTDYTGLKPKGHPVQPDVSEILDKAEEKMQELNCSHIYLATEDGKIDKMFRERFQDKILINHREYYDEIFEKNQLTWIKDVHFERENDDYLKGVEYLSSLVILSKCNAIVAGNCGGSQAAVFMNAGKYEDCYIYNLGLYE